jgi:hypothetical protein
MPYPKVSDDGGPETTTHDFVYARQSVLALEIRCDAWPLLRSFGSEHEDRHRSLVGIERANENKALFISFQAESALSECVGPAVATGHRNDPYHPA